MNADVVLINKAQATGQDGATYEIKEMKYDNGVWAYEYEGKAEIVNNGLNLTQVTTKAAAQSSAQMAAQDANKIAAGAAVTLFGADETLMERLGDVRNSADDNDGVWAKYVGGKIKVDGLQEITIINITALRQVMTVRSAVTGVSAWQDNMLKAIPA